MWLLPSPLEVLKVLPYWRSAQLFGPVTTGVSRLCNLLQCPQLRVTQELPFLHLVTVLSHASHFTATKRPAEVIPLMPLNTCRSLGRAHYYKWGYLPSPLTVTDGALYYTHPCSKCLLITEDKAGKPLHINFIEEKKKWGWERLNDFPKDTKLAHGRRLYQTWPHIFWLLVLPSSHFFAHGYLLLC